MDINLLIATGDVGRKKFGNYGGYDKVEFSLRSVATWEKDGQTKKRQTYISCEAWGRIAAKINQSVQDGDRIHIQASLDSQSWEDRDTGKKRYKLVAKVHDFSIIGGSASEGDEEDVPF